MTDYFECCVISPHRAIIDTYLINCPSWQFFLIRKVNPPLIHRTKPLNICLGLRTSIGGLWYSVDEIGPPLHEAEMGPFLSWKNVPLLAVFPNKEGKSALYSPDETLKYVCGIAEFYLGSMVLYWRNWATSAQGGNGTIPQLETCAPLTYSVFYYFWPLIVMDVIVSCRVGHYACKR